MPIFHAFFHAFPREFPSAVSTLALRIAAAMIASAILLQLLTANVAHAQAQAPRVNQVIEVELRELHPTQGVIAHAQVAYKLNRYRFEPQKQLDDICEARGLGRASQEQTPEARSDQPNCTGDGKARKQSDLKTAVVGPGGQLYLTDGHHTFSTFYEMPEGGPSFQVSVLITADKSELTEAEFWRWMQQNQLTWLRDANGEMISWQALPASLGRANLANDDFRAAMYFLRDLVWRKPNPSVPFVEFYWANHLRQQAMLQPPANLTDIHAYMRWLSKLAGYVSGMNGSVVINENGSGGQRSAGELGKFVAGTERELDALICDNRELGKLAFALLDNNAAELKDCIPNQQPIAGSQMAVAENLTLAMIEISSGSQQKWQQNHDNENWLEWELQNGSPRWVEFLGYPANYGIIPNTLLSKSAGGDGDPLDVLVLGSPLPQGTLIPVRIIGIMTMLDGGEQDDKLIAVDPSHPVFGAVTDIAELTETHPAIPQILQLWFENYKGENGSVTDVRFQERVSALAVLELAQ
ncbi:hypothetical protein CWE08_02630 [Aliidiomarina iranensis]|uniref:inorganic diphosphatase n=1 Tax=Aliidiomarina iranensis TaxID=1434071 RepID=A0A432W2W5_9GAMM|nr:ParB-like protein [Aliidiomarina iranensis]RUO23559.1 hypothetical protein CWE08_02630 [Aliidiomarina iranensis]